MARTYKRDARGRFSSNGGGGKGGKPKAKAAPTRAGNRLTRDNAGKITSIGKNGATARGGRLKTAAGNQRATQTARLRGAPAGTISKPKGLKPGAIKSKAQAKPARTRRPKIDDAKVSRVISRVNAVARNDTRRTGVKALNAMEVATRAKFFLARKEGGSVGILNQKSQSEAFASVRKAMTKPPRYSTQKPNRNKPGRFNSLGQDSQRLKAAQAAMTARQRIEQSNAKKTKLAAISKKDQMLRKIGPRALKLPPASVPSYVFGRRTPGTIAKPKPTTKISSTVSRTRSAAAKAQRSRRERTLDRTRPFRGTNSRVRRVQTGMSQLSLVGKPKPLVRFQQTSRRRR